MSDSLRQLLAAYDASAGYIERLRAERAMEGAAEVSEFWAEILAQDSKRRSHPSFEEMLVMRRGFTYPLGDRAKVGDGTADREYARSAHFVVSRSMDVQELARFDESALGAPPVERFGDQALSGGGIVNALTLHRIERALAEHGPDRPLRVLEIGAGYGSVAEQLLRRVAIERYVICDLPENLFLSGYYVPVHHPGRSTAFVGADGDPGGELAFVVPPYLDGIEGSFDLIVNTYSFQEMNRASVMRYLAFAAARLAPDGLLYSLNAHGKSGIERPAEYLVDGLAPIAVAPVRRFPWQVFGTNPYELVARPADRPRDAEQARRLDRVGTLMQLGLHDDLAPLCAAVVDVALPAADPAPVAAYVDAIGAFAGGGGDDAALAAAAGGLGESHAQVLAHLARAALSAERYDAAAMAERIAAGAVIAPHLEGQLRAAAADPDGVRAVLASHLDLPPAPARPGWQRRIGAVERHVRLKIASRTRR
jgi:putative sugar O-methyltransferase